MLAEWAEFEYCLSHSQIQLQLCAWLLTCSILSVPGRMANKSYPSKDGEDYKMIIIIQIIGHLYLAYRQSSIYQGMENRGIFNSNGQSLQHLQRLSLLKINVKYLRTDTISIM